MAPPIVPGIPLANSNPEISLFASFWANSPSFTPAPTIILNLSFSSSISIFFISIFNTIPSIPSSLTSKLLPFPKINIFSFVRFLILKLTIKITISN